MGEKHTEWQPIETARHDTRDVLVWRDGYLRPVIAWCDKGVWRISGISGRLPDPTHWMPLPATPTDTKPMGEGE